MKQGAPSDGPDAAWERRPEGGGRFAIAAIRNVALVFGRAPARLLLYPITLYFLIRRGPERAASRAYLSQVLGRPAGLWDVARHIHCFASVILDRVFLLSERFKRFDMRAHGLEDLHRVMDMGRGALLVGAHLGSFEALRVLSLQRPDAKVRVVLDVGHNQAITTLLHALNPALAASVIDARQDGTAIVLAIKDAVEGNALVTLLGDRIHTGEPGCEARFMDRPAWFPTAPWLIAAALKVPVVLCFGLYRGGNRYDLHFDLFAESVSIDRRTRAADLQATVQRYSQRLEHYVHLAPFNWFNFYDFWQTDRASPAVAAAVGVRRAAVDGAARG